MTDKDKTRQKLVDSIRKTKASVNDQAKASNQKEKLSGDSEQSTPSIQSEQTKTKSKVKSTTTTATTVSSGTKLKSKMSPRSGSQDPYQSGRRVWPD